MSVTESSSSESSSQEISGRKVFIVGLCTFLNPDGSHKHLPDPCVILVRTPGHREDHEGHEHEPGSTGSMQHPDSHIPFIGYDRTLVKVDDSTGFEPRGPENQFMILPIYGKEVNVKDDAPGTPRVDPSFAKVAKRDVYWKDAIGKYDDTMVGKPGGMKPNAGKVAAYMRFGNGKVAAPADQLTKQKWVFKENGVATTMADNYAREVTYCEFPGSPDEIVIELRSLKEGDRDKPERTIRFTRADTAGAGSALEVWLGNSEDRDIAPTMQHRSLPARPDAGGHFEFLNAIAGLGKKGPLPEPVPSPTSPQGSDDDSGKDDRTGDTDGGYCGPGNGNGGPP